MKTENEIRDDEIRIIGNDRLGAPDRKGRFGRLGKWPVVAAAVLFVVLVAVAAYLLGRAEGEPQPEREVTPVLSTPDRVPVPTQQSSDTAGYVVITEETVNDVPLYLYTPHHAWPTLELGLPDRQDSTIVFVAQAADVGTRGEIIGAFILRGEQLARALSKQGYCAIFDDRIEIGVSPDTPLFDEALERGGCFFRQYPLVDNGQPVENKPKGKAIRRAIGERRGEVVMVESRSAESFHDFAQALADLGFRNAIYLVGSTAYGWAVDRDGGRHEFGIENSDLPANTSYIVWRSR